MRARHDSRAQEERAAERRRSYCGANRRHSSGQTDGGVDSTLSSAGLNHVEVNFKIRRMAIEIICTAETSAQTGVEMEALTGVSVAALALYDMFKAVDKTMRIEGIRVVEKVKE